MRVFATYREPDGTPLLWLTVHNAPHRRMHHRIIAQYRRVLVEACWKADILIPITEPLEVKVDFIDPTSPDLCNLYLALTRAMDGAVVLDDSLIQKQETSKLYIHTVERAPKMPASAYVV